MTTVKSLHDDLLYIVLSKCTASIDMWHFLLALDYDLSTMISLQAFWRRIRLSSFHHKTILFSFIERIAMYCIDLRIDNLNWMNVTDLRHILAAFRLVVRFHSGNVALSKGTLTSVLISFFPFLKYVTLLIPLDGLTVSSSAIRQRTITDESFREICVLLNDVHELEHVALVLQDRNGGCLSDLGARLYFQLVCEYISGLTRDYKLVSIEENGFDMKNRFYSMDSADQKFSGSMTLSLVPTLNHLLLTFRSMPNVNLSLERKNSTAAQLHLQTLVLPCVPSTSESIDILDLTQLKILDIGNVNVKDRLELTRLDELLLCHRRHVLRNLSISLSQWQLARLVVVWKNENSREETTSTTEFSSVFENCFDQVSTPEGSPNPPDFQKRSADTIVEYRLEFLEDDQSSIFQLSLQPSWLTKLTNLNLTGIHCHSIEFTSLFQSLHSLRSLSVTPCLLLYLNQVECHCQTSTSPPYQMHALKDNLFSLNLVCHLTDLKQPCSTFLDQYRLHCIRHSKIHQYLKDNPSLFRYEMLIQYSIRTIFERLDLQHISLRLPNYHMQNEDLNIREFNHLKSLILDVRVPLTFHAKLTNLYAQDRFHSLRRFVLVSENNFQLTPLLIDRFRTLESVEIISSTSHLNHSTITYLQTVVKPNNYPMLNTFRIWVGSVDAQYRLNHLHKTIRLAFEKHKPAFQFDVTVMNSSSPLFLTQKCLLYDGTDEIQRDFHSLPSIHSSQCSIMYPRYLNFKPLYSEHKYDK